MQRYAPTQILEFNDADHSPGRRSRPYRSPGRRPRIPQLQYYHHLRRQEPYLTITDFGSQTAPSARGKLPPSNSSFLPTNSSTTTPRSSSNKHYLWTLSFYAQFFDVDTASVGTRCLNALYPRTNFLDILDGNPDLYGPFWIATTVVVILFLTGTISAYLSAIGKTHFVYDFTLLSGAAGLVYGYTFLLPLALWGILKYSGSEGANLLECWALYGCANITWIPVALVSWSPLTALNYAFVGVGFAVSVVFLFRNL